MEIEQVNKKLEILKYLFWSYTQTKSEEYEIDIETSYNPDVLSCLANLSNDEVFTPPTVVNDMLNLLPITNHSLNQNLSIHSQKIILRPLFLPLLHLSRKYNS
jgi:hypothetical protein